MNIRELNHIKNEKLRRKTSILNTTLIFSIYCLCSTHVHFTIDIANRGDSLNFVSFHGWTPFFMGLGYTLWADFKTIKITNLFLVFLRTFLGKIVRFIILLISSLLQVVFNLEACRRKPPLLQQWRHFDGKLWVGLQRLLSSVLCDHRSKWWEYRQLRIMMLYFCSGVLVTTKWR